MTLLDLLLLLGIVLGLAVRGYARGWLREGAGLFGAALLIALMIRLAGTLFVPLTNIKLLGLLAATLVAGIVSSALLSRLIAGSKRDHAVLSRASGSVLGALSGVVVYAGVFLMVTAAVPKTVEDDRTARSYPLLKAGAERLAALAPKGSAVGGMAYPEPLADEDEDARPPARPIAWDVAEAFGAKETRSLPGTVRAVDAATLAFEVSGVVSSVEVEAGERFERGQVLAALDDRTYRLTLRERQGQLAEARASLVEAEAAYERNAKLLGTGAVAQAVVDDKRAAFERARGQVQRLTASVDIAAENLADTRLIAPYRGTVASRQIEPAQRVAAGGPVLRVQSAEGLEVVASVPDAVVGRLEVGSRHDVLPRTLDGGALIGTVSRIDTDAERTNAYEVALRLTEPPEGLRTGSVAEVRFRLARAGGAGGRDDLVAIPATAFLAAEGQVTLAFVYDGRDGVVRARPVDVADLTGDRALVSDGLEDGEIVAAKGLPFLRDGQRVTLLGEGPDRYLVSQR